MSFCVPGNHYSRAWNRCFIFRGVFASQGDWCFYCHPGFQSQGHRKVTEDVENLKLFLVTVSIWTSLSCPFACCPADWCLACLCSQHHGIYWLATWRAWGEVPVSGGAGRPALRFSSSEAEWNQVHAGELWARVLCTAHSVTTMLWSLWQVDAESPWMWLTL